MPLYLFTMKFLSLSFLLLTLSLFLSGCATSPEDKAFFEQNWKQPGQIDAHMG